MCREVLLNRFGLKITARNQAHLFLTLLYSSTILTLTFSLPNSATALDFDPTCQTADCCPEGITPLIGSPAGELLDGGNKSQCIVGLGGNDTLNGGNQHDVILCGDGDDNCAGGNGNDHIVGGAGADVIDGGNGSDQIAGGKGNDDIQAGNGKDIIIPGAGLDMVDAGSGKDIIIIGAACEAHPGEVLNGGDDWDELHTAITEAELDELGVTLIDIEKIVLIDPVPNPDCKFPKPVSVPEEGPGISKADVLCAVLAQTAAVVEGTVESLHYVFEETPGEGPREIVMLSDIVVHLGNDNVNADSIKLRSFRGFMPNGDFIEASHTPFMSVGERYIFFLRGTTWKFSPIAYGYVFRKEMAQGQDILINQDGFAVANIFKGAVLEPMFTPERGTGVPDLVDDNPPSFNLAQTPEEYISELSTFTPECSQEILNLPFNPFPNKPWDEMKGSPKPLGF